MALNWRNQGAVNFTDAVAANASAGRLLGSAFDSMSRSTDYFRDNNIADFKKLGQDNTADLVANINSFDNLDTLQAEYQNSLSQMPTTNFDKQLATEALMKRQGVLQASAAAADDRAYDVAKTQYEGATDIYKVDSANRSAQDKVARDFTTSVIENTDAPFYHLLTNKEEAQNKVRGYVAQARAAGYSEAQIGRIVGEGYDGIENRFNTFIANNNPRAALDKPIFGYGGRQAQGTSTAQTATQGTQGQGTNKTTPTVAPEPGRVKGLRALDNQLNQNTPAAEPDVTVSPDQGNTQAPRTLEEEAAFAKRRKEAAAQVKNQATNETPFIGQDPYLTPEIAAANERADWLKRNDAANAAFKADVISVKDAAYNAAIEPIVKKATQAYDYVANTKLDGTRAFPERDARIAKEKDDDLIASQQLNQAIQRNVSNDLIAGIPIPDGSPRIPGTNNEIAQVLSNTAIPQEPVQAQPQTQLPAAEETPIYDEAIMAKEKYMSTVYPDQGADAIGYGHRLTGEEKLTGNIMVNGIARPYANGQFTEELARAKFHEDMAGKRKIVSKTWEGFNSLNSLDQRVITELGFNTKKPVNKKNWPELWKGMQMSPGPARTDKILKEIMRSYEKSDGTRKELTDRVSALRQAYRSAV